MIEIGNHPLRIDELVRVARHDEAITLSLAALERLDLVRASIDAAVAAGTPVYGVSTGFGSLATTFISPELRRDLQTSLIRSHAAGMGEPVEREVVRAMMLSRLTTLASGVSGVRRHTAWTYAELLNRGVTPVVREFGSLGCSGDLAPLAHVALVLMGEGEATLSDGRTLPGAEALAEVGLEPVVLAEKEGLALINGTDGMLGMLALALHDGAHLLDLADLSAALSVQALRGTDQVFRAALQDLRPHRGQATSAAHLYSLLDGSPIVASHTDDPTQVQDAYSLRCAPQVHGAARDTFAYATSVANVELSAAIDNPSILPDGQLASNGNFHGAPIAYVLDFLAIAVADLASIAERRTDRLMDPARNYGLPAFLAHQPGVDSGFMIAQYTQAALVTEMKRWATPASVDSIPSSAMQEDHVSLGWHAARKLRRSLVALRQVLAIELLSASRAMALRAPLEASAVTARVAAEVLSVAGGVGPDRYLSPDLMAAEAYCASLAWREPTSSIFTH